MPLRVALGGGGVLSTRDHINRPKKELIYCICFFLIGKVPALSTADTGKFKLCSFSKTRNIDVLFKVFQI